jgi:hypothetical protein
VKPEGAYIERVEEEKGLFGGAKREGESERGIDRG